MKSRRFAPFRPTSSLALAVSAAWLCHYATPTAHALTYYWDNDGVTPGFGVATGTWAAPTTGDSTQGWSTDTTGVTIPGNITTTTADSLNFGNAGTGLATGSIAVTGTVNANALTYASGSGSVTLSGGTIALGGTAPKITINKSGQVIGSALTLNANTSVVIGVSGASVASLDGAIGGSGNLTITTAASTVGTSGTNIGITLGGASNYTGTTLITTANLNNVMNVKSGAVNALPVTTVLTLDGGSGTGSGRQVSYDLVGKNQTLAGLSNVTRTSRTQRILNSSGTATLTIDNTSPASSTFTGNINGTGLSLVKKGTGTQTLGAGNTLNGTTTISGGKLQGVVGGNCASSKVVIDNILGTFAISITDNTKTWTCKELAPTAAGEIEFNFGAIEPSTTVSPLTITVPTLLTGLADFTAATPKIRVNTSVSLAPGTYPLMTWDTVAGTVPTTADLIPPTLLPQTVATLAVSGNTLNLVVTSTAVSVVKADNANNLNLGTSWVGGSAPDAGKLATWNSTVTSANNTVLGADTTWSGIVIAGPNGPVTINAGHTLTLGAAAVDIDMSAATADLALNCPLTLGDSNSWDVAATRTLTLAGNVSGAFGVIKSGDGTSILSSSSNTYTGNTTVAAGTLKLGADNVIPDGTGTGNIELAGTLDLNGKSETINGLSGAGVVDNPSASTTSTLTVGSNGQSSTFSGIIQNSGSSAVTHLAKTGAGTLTLSGANTLSGDIAINGGTLAAANASTLANASGITIASGAVLRGDSDGGVINAPITLGAATTTSTIHAPNVDGAGTTAVPFNFGGVISGAANLTLSGVEATNAYSTINLKAASNYTGSTLLTTVSGFAGGPPNNTNIFVRNFVQDALPVTTVVTLDGGDGGGSGRFCELNLGGNNQTLAGLTNVTGRVLRTQRVTSSSAATLTIHDSSDRAFSGQITGAISLIKSNTGTWTLSGTKSYTGSTAITGGTLALASNDVLPATAVTIGGGTLAVGAGFTDTVGTLAVPSAATINLGSASSALTFADSSAETWAGPLNITGNFVSGTSLRFGDGTGTGLTGPQLASITATGFTGFALDAGGFLTATAVGGSTFSDWLAANPPATGFTTDSDKDGTSNGVENVLGTSPNAYTAGLTEVSSTATSVTFKHKLNTAIASDVTYGYQWSTDLAEWKTSGQTNTGGTSATIVASPPDVNNVVTVVVTVTSGPGGKLFGRLDAHQAP